MTDFITPGSPTAPIADLTYRDYNGPLHTRAIRWWIVAVAGLRMLVRRPGFWIVAALSLLPHLFIGILLLIQSQPRFSSINFLGNYPVGQKYAAQFFFVHDKQWLWVMVIALMIGAGTIASDNRSNALLVYLSKPLTKGDYLLGKWMSVFIALFGVTFVPAFVLYVFSLLTYFDNGFLQDEPWLIVRIIGAAIVPAAIHASVIVGISAWSKSSRIAGATYAALFFVSLFLAFAFWGMRFNGDMSEGIILRHTSIVGTIRGLQQNIYGLTLLEGSMHRRRGIEILALDPPDLKTMLAYAAVLVGVGIAAARARINAVEVIRG